MATWLPKVLGRSLYVIGGVLAASLLWPLLTDDPTKPDPVVIRELVEDGWKPAETKKPKIKDAPKGTTPLVAGEGHVDFGRSTAGSGAGDVTPPPSSPLSACALTPEDLAGSCRFELVEHAGQPWARIWWTGKARLPHGQIVERGPILVQEQQVSVAPQILRPKWQVELRGGIGYVDGQLEPIVGATVYKSRRIGWWVQGSQRHIEGGVALKIGG